MPIYFSKLWHTGDDRDTNPGEPLDPQPDWPKPQNRPGWTVKYQTATGKVHKGKIRFALRDGAGRLDFYRVIRLKNDEPEITFDSSIIQRIEE